jgi:DNA-binding CsgD family transcriptional regulator
MARTPPPTADELCAAFATGDSVVEVAVRFGCSPRNVRHLAGQYSVTLPRATRRSTASDRLGDVGWLRSSITSGASKSAIAAELGVRPAEVDAALRASQLPTGPPSRADRRLDDEPWLKSRFAGGATTREIAAELGCVPATVNAAARRIKIARLDPWVRFSKLEDRVARQAPADAHQAGDRRRTRLHTVGARARQTPSRPPAETPGLRTAR